MGQWLPGRLGQAILEELGLSGYIAEISRKRIEELAARVHAWSVTPANKVNRRGDGRRGRRGRCRPNL